MKKNKSQLTTKQEKKLRRRLKFMLWVYKTFTKEKVMPALCGTSMGVSVSLAFMAAMQGNILGIFGFLFATLWISGSWTAFLIIRETSPKKKKSSFDTDSTLETFDLICKTGGNAATKNKNKRL